MFILENTKETDRIQKEIFDTVYGWGKARVITDQDCNTFKSMMHDLEYELNELFCEMYEICSACGEPNVDGHDNNNARCQDL